MKNNDGKGGAILKSLGRCKYVLLIAALGVILMLWPSGESGGGTAMETEKLSENDTVFRDLEESMEEILGKMQGVGRVDVMLALQSGSELVLASDTVLRYSGSPQNPNDYDRTSETVTVSGDNGTEVVVTEKRSPKYRGALVVCDGGDNDRVRLQVIEAVSALTGLGSDRIAVVRWGEKSVGTDGINMSGEDIS